MASSAYGYNSANQRTSVTNTDNSRWAYQYDKLGQVISGIKYWSDASVAAGQQFGYVFDDIGNRTTTTAGGSEFGANLRWANYSVNNLNQYTSRTVPAAVDVIGDATNTATVTVNNQGTYRKSTYYRKELAIDNSTSPVFQSVTNLAVLQNGTNADIITNAIGSVFLPKTPEAFTHDADGNLKTDGRWSYSWDAENRLISMTNITGVPTAAQMRLDFGYDYVGRRISKAVVVGGSTNSLHFTYDGWNLIAELNGTNHALIRSYMWGSDISGSMQGAGGVGGLLAISSPASAQFTCFDGNGNIKVLIDSTNSTISGQYEYGPFGEVIRASGPMAKANPFRFSTKYQDDESDLVYYGYRFYTASIGKWLSRDPIEENGGQNLYSFSNQNAVNNVDLFGLIDYYLGSIDPTYTPPPTGAKPIPKSYRLAMRAAAAMDGAVLASKKYPNASKLFKHYLNGSGTDTSIDLENAMASVLSVKQIYESELNSAKIFAKSLSGQKDGTYQIDSRELSQGNITPDENGDWFLAIGGYAGWGKGTVTICKDVVILDFTYTLVKRYQWQVNLEKYVMILGILKITDEEVGELQEAGYAKEFNIKSTKAETVTVSAGNSK